MFHSRSFKYLTLLVAIIVVSIGMQLDARAQLPADVFRQMEQRETAFSRSLFTWQIDSRTTFANGKTPNYTAEWTFQTDSDKLLASGQVSFGPGGLIQEYQQYYDGKNALVAHVSGKVDGGPTVSPNPPQVWSCPGDCVRFRNAIREGLDLWADDIMLLTGKTPFALYNAQWNLVSTTPQSYVMATHLTDTSPYSSACNLQLMLDRAHDNTTQQIILSGQGWKREYQVLRFRRFNNQWMAAEFTSAWQVPQIINQRHLWRLKSVEPSPSLSFTVPHRNLSLMDFRLVSASQNAGQIMTAIQQNDPRISQYKWTGHLPTIEELGGAQAKIGGIPAQAGSRGWLLWVPGILLIIVGAFWSWRLSRRASSR